MGVTSSPTLAVTHARTLIAHDHQLFVSGLERLLAPDYDIVGAIHDLQLLLDAVRRLRPDLVLQDLSNSPSVGLRIITDIVQSMPETRIVVVTMWVDGTLVKEALKRGASAYVPQTATTAELLEGVRHALEGRRYVTSHLAIAAVGSLATVAPILTPRQIAVVRLLAQGRSMKEAASVLGLSQRTVAFHKYNVMQRLNIRSSAELVRFAITQHLV